MAKKEKRKGEKVSIPKQIKSTWGKLEWARAVIESKQLRRGKLVSAITEIDSEITFLQSLTGQLEEEREKEANAEVPSA